MPSYNKLGIQNIRRNIGYNISMIEKIPTHGSEGVTSEGYGLVHNTYK